MKTFQPLQTLGQRNAVQARIIEAQHVLYVNIDVTDSKLCQIGSFIALGVPREAAKYRVASNIIISDRFP